MNVTSTNYIEDVVRKRVFRTEKDTMILFYKLFHTLQTDPEARHSHKNYIYCIKLLSVERVDDDVNFDPKNEKLTNTANLSMYNIYIQTPLDPKFETFKEETLQRKRVLV